jgi:glycosyltransferase 2 family protein
MNLQKIKSSAIHAWNWLRYLVGILPIIWIFHLTNIPQLVRAAGQVTPWTIPIYTAIVLLSMTLQGVRWWVLIRAFIPALPFSRAMSCHFTGLFYSIALPGNAAQDLVRALLISKDNDYSVVWGSTWLSRILGLFALALLSLYGLFAIDTKMLPHGFLFSVISAFVVLAILFVVSFSKRVTNPGRLALKKILPGKIFGILENVREAIYKYRHKKREILYVSIITIIMQVLLVAAACFAIWGITGRLLAFECMAFIPIVELLCIALPLTPNGLGIRESLLAIMFLHIGLTTEQLGIYILFGFYSIFLKLVGGLPVLFGLTVPARPQSR